jgi:hypothetical protein
LLHAVSCTHANSLDQVVEAGSNPTTPPTFRGHAPTICSLAGAGEAVARRRAADEGPLPLPLALALPGGGLLLLPLLVVSAFLAEIAFLGRLDMLKNTEAVERWTTSFYCRPTSWGTVSVPHPSIVDR